MVTGGSGVREWGGGEGEGGGRGAGGGVLLVKTRSRCLAA